MVLQGSAPRHKTVGWLLLKAALLNNEGYTIGLDDLTTAFLTTDKRGFAKARDVPVLHLIVGEEYTQTIHKFVCKHIHDHRLENRFHTIWSTQLMVNELVGRYGNLAAFHQDTTIWLNIPSSSEI